jgi:hypothetical protein
MENTDYGLRTIRGQGRENIGRLERMSTSHLKEGLTGAQLKNRIELRDYIKDHPLGGAIRWVYYKLTKQI